MMDTGQQTAAALLLLSPVLWGLCGLAGIILLWRKGYGRAAPPLFGLLGTLGGPITLCLWPLLPRKVMWTPMPPEPPVIDITPDRTTARAQGKQQADMERFLDSTRR